MTNFTKYLLSLFIVALMPAVTSCGDDNDEPEPDAGTILGLRDYVLFYPFLVISLSNMNLLFLSRFIYLYLQKNIKTYNLLNKPKPL